MTVHSRADDLRPPWAREAGRGRTLEAAGLDGIGLSRRSARYRVRSMALHLLGGRPIRSLVLLAVVLAGLIAQGCGPSLEQAVEIYTRNDTPDEFGYLARPATNPALIGVMRGVSGGCVRLPRPWNLIIYRGTSPQPGPDHAEVATVSSMDYVADAPAVVWISVGQGGDVETGRGVPAWWIADVQHCT